MSTPQQQVISSTAPSKVLGAISPVEEQQTFSSLIWRFWINDVVGFIKDTLFDLYDSVMGIFRSVFGDFLQEILNGDDDDDLDAKDLLQGPAEENSISGEGATKPPRGWFGSVFG
ncbi:hypothetical protein TYRP_006445 [Tyrophagus putrescentiae]|nr:hypothetical protein TYRP_006445 [Tyrophagus putrescentiae]